MPIAGRSARFPGLRPKLMLAAPTGRLMLEMSLSTVPDWRGKRVVIGGLRQHLEDQHGEVAIRRALGESVEIVSFDRPTSGPAETISQMIQRAEVFGPIFIKDCDSWFSCEADTFDDVVCVANLQNLPNARNVAGKSFIKLNEHGIIEGILEKQVSSDFISVGGYGFHDATLFTHAYQSLTTDMGGRGEVFISHVIVEAMRRGAVFRGVLADNYEDVGTLEAWNAYRARHQVFFVDLDGVVFRNSGEFRPPFWDDPDITLPDNVAALRRVQQDGAQFVFVTARPERYRESTEQALRAAGLSWHACVFGVHHSTRVLINDYAGSNPFPSAVAINTRRDDDHLAELLPK